MRITRRKKMIAVFFLFIFTAQLLLPNISYALTSGPSQPEMAKFEPAGTSEMVDLFSGDMKYNIPLMDVGGYPINISYQSGTGMEDEASWVGTGWTLNPGAVNRTMRGLPDDFNGDEIKKTFYTKPFKKVGGAINAKATLFGWEKGSVKGSVELGIYKDNYYGIGASVGAGLGFQLSVNTKTSLNAGLNLLSDTRGGVDITANAGITTQLSGLKEINSASLSGGFGYNTRQGLKSVSLGLSFEPARENLFLGNSLGITYEKSFGQTYTPVYSVEKKNSGFTFSFDAGGLFTGFYGGVGGKGYTYNDEIISNNTSAKGYGYMNYLRGRSNVDALLDFNREKDGVFIKNAPAIAIPVSTHDYFNVSAQTGGQQFRPFFGGNYVVFDKRNSNVSNNTSVGLTVGGGSLFQGGGNVYLVKGGSHSAKWVANNAYLSRAEANFNSASLEEEVFFKQVGEKTLIDEDYFEKIGNEPDRSEQTNRVVVNQYGDGSEARTYTLFKYRGSAPAENIPNPIKREKREKRISNFSFLNALQASMYGLDKTINGESRVTSDKQAHHISEITVTDNEGKRMVYGIPVYNKIQRDITFAVQKNSSTYEQSRKTGLYTYTPGADDRVKNGNGRDHYYSKEDVPPYATSYLLTGILSPDYVDRTNNGISDDDPGTAVKFNYTKLANDFQWRAPYGLNKANYNEGFMSDHLDEKASISYGKKEIWYLQSVESKTMIAIFETSNRDDGLGVSNEQGTPNTSVLLKKLDKIKLYSKADWIRNGANAIPVKTVLFYYDYSLWQNTPNVIGADPSKGKLTLRKIVFEFGKSTRGQSNPYEFEYDIAPVNSNTSGAEYSLMDPLEKNDKYTERQSDRWGTYKQSFYNRTKTLAGGNIQPLLNNSEFPYVPQENVNTPIDERGFADRFASKWQLTKITTPSSGVITVTYESDDYAYVQNRKAMQMCFVKGVENPGQSNNLIDADRIVIELPKALIATTLEDRKNEFKEKYLSMGGGKYHESVFYKILTNLNNTTGKDEYVHGYAEINWNTTDFVDATTVRLGLKKIKPDNSDVYYNPISIAAWQMLRADLPQYAYDNYDNLEVGDGQAVIRSIIQAIKNYIGELGRPFEARAAKRKFANTINLDKSMVRLTNPYNAKIGGGARVKKIQISDEWNVLVAGGTAAVYGQEYDYTIKDKLGNVISSSGVASYEPQIGNEENPFHEPINFTEKVHWSNDRYHFIEKPFCESYFPAASVGYSKVTVTTFGAQNAKETGSITNEFYTAKEFPTFVDYLTLDTRPYENSLTIKLFTSKSIDKIAASQGFRIELNDMHGKPKNVKVYNKGGDLISSTEYFYSVKDDGAEVKELNNTVDILLPEGTISSKQIGTDIDFVTDVRESVSNSDGDVIGISGGVTLIPPFPIFFIPPFPVPYIAPNYSHSTTISSFHSISSVKVVHKYGIVKKVITTQNGSTIEAENLLWDGETGEVLLTRTQNEFDKSTYAFSYPAYAVADYEGMGGAYKNLGATFASFITGADGKISTLSAQQEKDYLFAGDELVNLAQTADKGWIIKGPQATSSDPDYRLIDKNGDFIMTNGSWMIIRSGRRNMLTAGVGSVITMKDPRVGNQIVLDVDKRILDSKSIEFKEEWAIPVSSGTSSYEDCSSGGSRIMSPAINDTITTYKTTKNVVEQVRTIVPRTRSNSSRLSSAPESCTCSCLKVFFDYLINTNQLFIQQSQNITVGQLRSAANTAGYNIGSCPILDNNLNKLFYALTSSAIATIYTAKIGDCIVSIRSNSSNPVSFYGLTSELCTGSAVVNYSASIPQTISDVFYSDCAITKEVFGYSGYITTPNSQRIAAGEYQDPNAPGDGFVSSTDFRIPRITEIPTNATINSANLFLYANPQGFHPPEYPHAHATVSETGGISPIYLGYIYFPASDCSTFANSSWNSPYPHIMNITDPFQDCTVDIQNLVSTMVSQQKNWLAFRNDFIPGREYATFCSNFYPDPTKHPRLEINYTIPAITQNNVATLSIDECNSCSDPVGQTINPYYAGLLGNWRPLMNYAFTVAREQKPGNIMQVGGTDIRNSGYYSAYSPFWNWQSGVLARTFTSNQTLPLSDPRSRWVWSNKSIYYDQKGNEIESVDALNRFGAALFGYRQSVATAVGANARNNEIAFDGYEDYDFDLETVSTELCPLKRHLDFGFIKLGSTWTSPGGTISTEQSHTGKYSYKLSGTTTINKSAGNAAPPSASVLSYDGSGRYLLNSNELANGFAPINGKKYLFSCWVYDGSPTTNTLNGITVTVNGVSATSVTVVEGWKRIEIPFIASAGLNLVITGSGKYIDDVRILPNDGQMNSYVYDNRTMRLMAQLDENNFATLYEYDDEGTPVRVKKETERGIMTLKENRQALRKRN